MSKKTTIQLTSKQLHVLQHSIGVDGCGQGRQYRNHFATGPGSKDWDLCRELVAIGLMQDNGQKTLLGGMHYFSVTPEGIDAVAFQSPRTPKLSKAKQRYREFLRADYWDGSFLDWLYWRADRDKEFRQSV